MSLHDTHKPGHNSKRERDRIEWTVIMYGIAGMSAVLVFQSIVSAGVWSVDFFLSIALFLAIGVVAYKMGCSIFQFKDWFNHK